MKTRKESDTMGSIEVPADRYWGAQTQRSLENFVIGGQRFPRSVIYAFGAVKKAAAAANLKLGTLDAKVADLISRAATEVMDGKFDAEFPLVVWQTGSGTQSNMNANEVIANRANELAGVGLGHKSPVHPNDDVNRSQSSNDVFPTVMHVAAVREIGVNLLPALDKLLTSLEAKSKAYAQIVKTGRTHMMDATPITLGQEFSGYVAQLQFARSDIAAAQKALLPVAIGGTAVGTGLNTPPNWSDVVTQELAQLTGFAFSSAPNKFMALAGHEPMVRASGALKTLATACFKIANDIRLLASGPRCAIGEIIIPANEPGSSIMPGKVNPTQTEALTMVSAMVFGYDTALTIGAASGHLELNVYKPLIIYAFLESLKLLSQAMDSFAVHCIDGITPNLERIKLHLDRSLMLVTALTPLLGYDACAKAAKLAYEKGLTLREAVVDELKLITAAKFDEIVNPALMV